MSRLAAICDRRRAEVRAWALSVDLTDLQRRAVPCTTDVLTALRRPADVVTPRVIAEHKRRSPSKGWIRQGSSAPDVARAYADAGAAAISVLTDLTDFGGTTDDLIAVRSALAIPVLRKDFMLSPLQILESRALGADLILLIVAALQPGELTSLYRLATDLGMTALIEVHDAHELDVALRLDPRLIGINARNLHTLEVDLDAFAELGRRIPPGPVRVAESGMTTSRELLRAAALGYDAVLVGEHLMRAPEPGQALRALLAGVAPT